MVKLMSRWPVIPFFGKLRGDIISRLYSFVKIYNKNTEINTKKIDSK